MESSQTAAVVGASGYAGAEAVRYLSAHPSISVETVCSRSYVGESFADHYPRFSDEFDLTFRAVVSEELADHDVVFLSVPHGTSMEYVSTLRGEDCLVVDLAADYRFTDPGIFERVYGQDHVDPRGVEEAVFGLSEHFTSAIREATLVANPGCYSSSMLLPLIPLLEEDLLEGPLFVDAKSGISGAGRSPSQATTFVQCNEDIRPYKVGDHRHEDEVKDHLPGDVDLHFVPHVIPVDRGIESAIYAQPAGDASSGSIEDCLLEFAAGQPLIRYREDPAGIKAVAHTPYCDLSVTAEDGWVVVFSTLDNLGKGAASQAVQNANLMLGWPSETGLLPD